MTQVTLGLTGPFSHGRGFSEPLAVTNPAANTGFTIKLEGSYWERLAALTFRLTTDSNADNRLVTLTVNGGDGIPLAIFPAASVQAASLAYDYSFLPNVSTFNAVAGTSVISPAPVFFLQPTYTLVVSFTNGHVADAITRIRYYRERFVTGPQGYEQGSVDNIIEARVKLAEAAELLA